MSTVGMKPATTPASDGFEITTSNRKHSPMVAISTITSASSQRNPFVCRKSTTSTSNAVSTTPTVIGNVKEQIERDRRADHLGEIARGDRRLADDPLEDHDRPRIMIAARLREIAARDDAELGRKPLQQHRHQIRQQDHAQQPIAERGSAGEIGCPVARIHVADGNQVPGSRERQRLSPRRRARSPAPSDTPRPDSASDARVAIHLPSAWAPGASRAGIFGNRHSALLARARRRTLPSRPAA